MLDPALEAQALAILRADEGERKYPYDDATGKRVTAPVGNVTVGVGIDLDAGLEPPERMWLEDHRLRREYHALMGGLVEHEPHVYLALLPRAAQLALALMAFQLGAPRLLRFRKMFAALARRGWDGAAKEALDSKWARETPHRAARVAALLRSCATAA